MIDVQDGYGNWDSTICCLTCVRVQGDDIYNEFEFPQLQLSHYCLHHVVVCLLFFWITIMINNVSLKRPVISLHRVPHMSITDHEPQSLSEG